MAEQISAWQWLIAPLGLTTVSATLQGFDFNLVRAASSLGANPVSAFAAFKAEAMRRGKKC